MEAFGIIDILRNYCIENDIYFIPGDSAYVNAISDENIYKDNDLILIANFTSSPNFYASRITSNKYSGLLALGRKREITDDSPQVETESSLDETFEQKYDRRLRYLANRLAGIIGDIACENEYEVDSVNFKLQLNDLDLNADFVACTLNFNE